MAAGRNIKGITIEIGGDTTGLQKALSDVNGKLKSTQAQLKDVNNLLKLDPSNTVLDLHSTMLLLYRVSKDMSINANANLHSTMLLLYQDANPQKIHEELIYIPLCFYFIV